VEAGARHLHDGADGARRELTRGFWFWFGFGFGFGFNTEK
jgi:hypothetical protein